MDFHERSTGVSKWTLKKKIKLFIDSFVAFSFAPIQLVTIIGLILFAIGILIGIIAIINKIANPNVPVGYSTMICILALGFGITNISLGIVAEYLWRTYDAARKRPCFIISDKITIKDGKTGR
jgi:dolichol-phosphate mannosyltransferase